jgi:hypothetical protein
MFDDLRQRMADEPNPPPARTQGGGPSAQARRNRLRIGLPEYPTKCELERWRTKQCLN